MIRYLQGLNKITIIIIGLIVTIILGIFDLVTGVEYSFAIFYLVPISFVAWYAGKKYGIVFSFISSIAWLNADMQMIERYSNPTAPYWNALVRLGFFLAFVILISQLKKLETDLEKKVEEKTIDLIKQIEERKKTEIELQKNSDKLSDLANRVLKMQDEQNIHIAREIHDELGQAMTAIKIDLMWLSKRYSANPELVESLVSISQTVDDAITTIRQISSNLRPKLLDELGFIPAVERYLKDYRLKTGIDYAISYNKEDYDLEISEQNALFRILQEALTNTSRHSQASKVDINIISNNSYKLDMSITDNGRGLPAGYDNKQNSLGIIGMKERAEGTGGFFSASSSNGSGTTINIKLPKK
jgi:signal transduction histidine kinase